MLRTLKIQVTTVLPLAVLLLLISVNCSFGQATPVVNPLKSHDVKMPVTSNSIYHIGDRRETVWSETVVVDDAIWIRLKFDQLVLAGSPLGGASSTLKITSLQDGKFQLLNADTVQQWRNTSAYFNGNAVRLELIAEPNGRMNLVQIGSVVAGEPQGLDVNQTICDGNDDRQLSDDPRSARGEPIGCSCWQFNDRNNCFITAGHCATGTDIAMFNVPLSDSNGNRQFPGPEDQYAVDQDSMQFVNGGVGNDWCYFGCFPNANTGLTAFEAQGASYELGTPGPVNTGDEIRITGYGSTSFPVDPTWNSAQKTQVGLYSFFSNQNLGYRTDTTGGNSGSPIIFESTGQAIGVHTHGGCGNSGSGMNNGTSISQNGFTNALNNPQGICALTIDFEFLTELPVLLNPNGGDSVQLIIDDADIGIDPTTAMLNVNDGSGFVAVPLILQRSGTFEAVFPATQCGNLVDYYFSVQTIDGEEFTNPANAPTGTLQATSAMGIAATPFTDNFETDLAWSVTGNASTGQWERGVPVGGGDRNDPPNDADGSGSCYLTENMDGNSDIDNGSTILTSPVMDASSSENQVAFLSYYRWFNSEASGDAFLVEISNDNGSTWQTLENITSEPADSTGGWIRTVFEVREFVLPTDQMRVRFTASDTFGANIVEAGVDSVIIELVDCETETLLGDVNLDGVVNLLDVAPFVALLSDGIFQAEGDINGDGLVNLLDVTLFVDLLSN